MDRANLAKEAETIADMLRDEVPLVNWRVEYDGGDITGIPTGFRIRAGVLVNDVPINAMCTLDVNHYHSGKWLEYIVSTMVHLIANQILKTKQERIGG